MKRKSWIDDKVTDLERVSKGTGTVTQRGAARRGSATGVKGEEIKYLR